MAQSGRGTRFKCGVLVWVRIPLGAPREEIRLDQEPASKAGRGIVRSSWGFESLFFRQKEGEPDWVRARLLTGVARSRVGSDSSAFRRFFSPVALRLVSCAKLE